MICRPRSNADDNKGLYIRSMRLEAIGYSIETLRLAFDGGLITKSELKKRLDTLSSDLEEFM